MEQLLGIDISAAQGANLDWPAIAAADVAFAICKATEHATYADKTFVGHAKAARAAGLLVGSYHFFRPEVDPGVQAKHYFERAASAGVLDLPPVMDFESLRGMSGAEAATRALRFVEETEGLWGRPCVVYTYPAFWAALGNPASPELGKRPLWIAHYGAQTPAIPRPWKSSSWAMWQFDGNGGRKLPGGRDSDFDWFRGSREDLQSFAKTLTR